MAIAIVRSRLRFSVTLHPQNKLQMHYVVVFFVPQYIAYWLCFIWTWIYELLISWFSSCCSSVTLILFWANDIERNIAEKCGYATEIWWSGLTSCHFPTYYLISFCRYLPYTHRLDQTLKIKMYLWIIYSVYYSLNMMIYWLTRWVMCFHLVTRKLIKSLPLHLIYNRIYHDDTSLTEEWFILE